MTLQRVVSKESSDVSNKRPVAVRNKLNCPFHARSGQETASPFGIETIIAKTAPLLPLPTAARYRSADMRSWRGGFAYNSSFAIRVGFQEIFGRLAVLAVIPPRETDDRLRGIKLVVQLDL